MSADPPIPSGPSSSGTSQRIARRRPSRLWNAQSHQRTLHGGRRPHRAGMGVASTVAMTAGGGLFGDLRLAVRSLLRTPGFTAVAVLAMAVGIGGTSALFSGFDMLLFRPLPPPASERLVTLFQRHIPG